MSTTTDKNVAATKRSYSKIYQQYVTSNSALRDAVKQSLDSFVPLLSGKNVLDVGCAGGLETEYLHSKGLAVTGCDISEEFVRIAQERCPECNFFATDMRHIKNHSNSYDGIWVNASFLHVPKADAPATLKNFYDMLRPKGILYISVMMGDFDALRENKDMNWPERHFSDYHEDELQGLLEQAGFKILRHKSNPTSWGRTFLHFFCTKD
jgi:2-polyprenyl-3-methyl-5-hydroxy-6-metoxy-1,4-benzoquinol methylase